MAEQSRSGEVAVQVEDDLSEVHSFYLYLLESHFGHEIPVSGLIAHETDALRRFVMLLDLAVTPQMIRTGFRLEEHRETAGALLRFYALKPNRRREDRDKADVIATTFFRALYPTYDGTSARPEDHRAAHDFQQLLEKIFDGMTIPTPPIEHVQLVRRFDFLRDEASGFPNFDALIDSGIMQRVRGIKQSLSPSFLHPSVLSVVAAYNVFFHQIFDRLFSQAAKDMRSFASQVEREGGNIVAPSEDEETSTFDEPTLEREKLQHISQLRRPAEPDQSAPSDIKPVVEPESNGYGTPSSTLSAAEAEAQELAAVESAIRAFVRAADAHAAHLVPLPNGNIQLTDAEAEAFRADFGEEKSFRADFAAVLIQIAALEARLRTRLEEFEKTRNTPYNWKPHTDALAHLLSAGGEIVDRAMDLATLARQRGLADKEAALNESVEKIRPCGRAAVEALHSIQPKESE